MKQAELGTLVKEIIRKMGITEQTYYRWKKKHGGPGTSELRRLRQLEDENRTLKQMVANLSLDKHMHSRNNIVREWHENRKTNLLT